MKFNFLKPKRVFWVGLFSSAMFLFPLSSLALTVQEVPNPRQEYGGWVTDMAGILSNETETQINQMISQLEAKNGTEMAVVTVSETVPAASPKKFAIELFNYWGIGKKGQDKSRRNHTRVTFEQLGKNSTKSGRVRFEGWKCPM
ncbi:hypothetical protein F7734_14925 [Scytonema sp. UIC 10036]|uniref:TPM domain-containing protein n=1 Tax=Scytonema sp. UIC 10036 TaxID=2304196 RepID=UPI0012DAAF47|nr:TPM domain-containing protein [Scytonema sp. UIC 10036]MUG93641.1 hypothetical protein [Scytonema sp. UIC 10036]